MLDRSNKQRLQFRIADLLVISTFVAISTQLWLLFPTCLEFGIVISTWLVFLYLFRIHNSSVLLTLHFGFMIGCIVCCLRYHISGEIQDWWASPYFVTNGALRGMIGSAVFFLITYIVGIGRKGSAHSNL